MGMEQIRIKDIRYKDNERGDNPLTVMSLLKSNSVEMLWGFNSDFILSFYYTQGDM